MPAAGRTQALRAADSLRAGRRRGGAGCAGGTGVVPSGFVSLTGGPFVECGYQRPSGAGSVKHRTDRLVRFIAVQPPGVPMSTDRVVLVTGGNRGIGRAIAERFVAEGYRVAVTARSGEGPEGTLTVRADVTDAAAVDAAFTEVEAQLGPVEIVVANAGITKDTLLLRMTEDDFDSVISTNLGGTFRVVKRASKGMLRARWGRVILISSVVGLYGSAGPDQLRGIQERAGRLRPLAHARAGRPRHHRERRRARASSRRT